jgi:hypothetical protein
MENYLIKKIGAVGKKIGLKEKPPVKQRDILFVAGFLVLNEFKIVVISDGLLNKKDFLTPCIVFDTKKKPKIKAWLKSLLNKYNKTRKNIDKKEKFSILTFSDGTARLDFGNLTNLNLEENFKKLSFADKKKKMKQFLNEFGEFKKYLINQTPK